VSEPFLGQITIFAGNFAPRNWALCHGQILPINQNQALFSLLGITYGGDGRTSFALPDLRGRTALHPGIANPGDTNVPLGQRAGAETVPLSANQIPSHTHKPRATSDIATTGSPDGAQYGTRAAFTPSPYGDPANGVTSMDTGIVGTVGGQGHNNMQPYLAINYIIAVQGVFPSRN